MRNTWILATALAVGFSPALSQAREREHGTHDRPTHERSGHAVRRSHEGRSQESRSYEGRSRGGWSHEGRSYEGRSYEGRRDWDRGRASHDFHRAPRYRGGRSSIHIHAGFLPSYRHGYFWSGGYYYPRYYFEYNAYPERASLRIQADPPQAEVYVDGYYAGIVDDFDGVFQRLHVTPGTHEITLRLDGYRTWSAEIYAAPGSTVNVHQDLIPGPAAEPEAEPGPEADADASVDPGADVDSDEN